MLLLDASTLILLAKTELLDDFLADFPEKPVTTKGSLKNNFTFLMVSECSSRREDFCEV